VGDGRDQVFRVGDSLPGGAILKRVTINGVFVERKGELESLSFPQNKLIFEAQPKPLNEEDTDAN
jgi:general secretion pathway protein C